MRTLFIIFVFGWGSIFAQSDLYNPTLVRYFSKIDPASIVEKINHNNINIIDTKHYESNKYVKVEDDVVVFWHKLALSIAADYNRPVKSKDGLTYPVATRENPYQYPKFPYSSPPYTARMLAYLSVLMYDTHQFIIENSNKIGINSSKRNVESSLNYAAAHLLTYFYPCEAVSIENVLVKRLAQLDKYDNISNKIGTIMANEILDIAKNDNFENNKSLVLAQYKYPTESNFEAWKSLDIPNRPPLLPKFGLVKTWHLNDKNIGSVTPQPPPSIGSEQFMIALAELKKYSKSLTKEQTAIANFWADGPGSSTPPGHWNNIALDLMESEKISFSKKLEILAYLNTAMMDAAVCCWQTKYYYAYPRPNQIDPSIQTILGVPNFPSYTSGHSTFSGAAATILAHYFPKQKKSLDKMAINASESRIYGCIHYRFDCEAGLECGIKIGKIALRN